MLTLSCRRRHGIVHRILRSGQDHHVADDVREEGRDEEFEARWQVFPGFEIGLHLCSLFSQVERLEKLRHSRGRLCDAEVLVSVRCGAMDNGEAANAFAYSTDPSLFRPSNQSSRRPSRRRANERARRKTSYGHRKNEDDGNGVACLSARL